MHSKQQNWGTSEEEPVAETQRQSPDRDDGPVAVAHPPEAVEAERGSHQPPHVKLSPRKVFLLGMALLVLFALIFVLGYLPRLRNQRITAAAVRKEETALPIVQVEAAQRSSSQTDLELPGTTAALVEAPIYARAAGYVGKRYVDIGDRVRAGQLLATIEAPDLDQQVDQARSTLQQSESVLGQTEAQLNLQKVTWDRYKVLVERGVISKQDADTQQASYLVAEANVKAAQNNISANKANLDRLLKLQSYERVTAPFAGIVTARNIDVGSLISATGSGQGFVGMTGAAMPSTGTSQGGEMFRVAQIDRLRTFASVPEVYAQYITVGEDVKVYAGNMGGTAYEGKVTRTANAVDPVTRTLLTEVQVPNKDGQLLPGMYTRVVFAHVRAEPPVVVPSDAIIVRANGITLAVVEDGTVRVRHVVIGRDYGAQTEILSGVRPGEMVIVNPTDAAQEGAKVQSHELKAASAGAPGGAPGANSPDGTGGQGGTSGSATTNSTPGTKKK